MAIDFTNFQNVFSWVMEHGYLLIFLVMCVEGPVTTAAAGLAAALGYLNVWIVLAISILGDLIPDTLYYFIGYFVRFPLIEKIGQRLGITEKRVLRMENLLREHFTKTIIVLKFTPFITTTGFMLVGYLRSSFRKFIGLCSAVTIPKSAVLLAVGYFFGQLYNINQYLRDVKIFLPIVVIFLVIVFGGYRKFLEIISKKIEKV